MLNSFDRAFKSLKELEESQTDDSIGAGKNEAMTRLQLIDKIFFDCLGWDIEDCSVEKPVAGEYADYTFQASPVNLVVEAKREGTSFTLPAGTSKQAHSISYFRKHEPKVYEAIEQAIGYCTKRGVQFGAVSNGHQMVAFLGSRTDGVPPLEGRALVFPDVLGMDESEFLQLWQTMSKPGLKERNLLSRLHAGEPSPPPEKPSAQIPNYPGVGLRNDLQVNLQILADVIIQDIGRQPEEEREFLTKCYAKSGALSQYALVSRRILETRYAQLSQGPYAGPHISSATTRSGPNPNLFADAAASRPILLIGDIGVGKTTFIRNWINVDARELAAKSIILYMDLGVKPTLTRELDEFVAEEITRQLRDNYSVDIEEEPFLRAVYHGDLQNFEKGVWGSLRKKDELTFLRQRAEYLHNKVQDTHDHLRRCLDHIVKGRQRQVIIFFDNLDQRPDDFQQSAFLLGQSVAELWPAMVFMTLRPETYHRSRISGTLNAYHQRAFTISPPRIDQVVEKRIRYALEMLESGKLMEGQVVIDAPSLTAFLNVLAYSFQENQDLIEFIDNVCRGNVRLALEFIKVFIGSGHVNTPKIIEIYESEGQYLVPLHEFLRAVMYGDHYWYDPRATEVKNILDITELDGREHFIILCGLAFVDRSSQQADSAGYVSGMEVSDHLGSLGFRMSQAIGALERMLLWNLVEPDVEYDIAEEKTLTDGVLNSRLRLTTIGSYYFRKLVVSFPYLDAVVVDTPVLDQEFKAQILVATSISARLRRAERFCSYLDSQWYGLAEAGAVFDWTSSVADARREIASIRERLAWRERFN